MGRSPYFSTMPDIAAIQAKMRMALDLHDSGKQLMKKTLLRKQAADPSFDAETAYLDWLLRRKDAIPGDVAGAVSVRRSPHG